MAGLTNYGRNTVQRKGNDLIYGQGTDGSVTSSSTVTLTSDLYYTDLTLTNATWNLNGFRLFVSGTLTLTNSVISASAVAATGTVTTGLGTVLDGQVLGGAGGGQSITAAPSWIIQDILQIVNSRFMKPATASLDRAYGGGPGALGNTGNTTPALTNSDTWSGKAGTAGNTGGYSPNANTVGAAGGKGYTGNSGTATGATAGIGGAGGSRGTGGPIAMIIAKTIVATGSTIYAVGGAGGSGSTGTTGTPGTAGNTGANAPSLTVNHGQTGNTNIAGCNTHQTPYHQCNSHQCNSASFSCNHGVPFVYCTQHHPSGNCVNHDHSHHCAAGTHVCNSHSCASHQCNSHSCNSHQCNAHSCNSHSGHNSHVCNTGGHYAGGTGGAGGAAAPAVTGGTGGQGSGGGGGTILLITDSTPTGLTYLTTGGTGLNNGSPGTSYVILNQ